MVREELLHSYTLHRKLWWEAGGRLISLWEAEQAVGKNIFFLLFKFQRGKNPEQIILVTYLKPLSLGLGEL